MSKKNFAAGLNALLGDSKAKRIKTETKSYQPKTAAEKGCKEGETRATFIVNKETLEKIYSIAYWDRLTIKELIYPALQKIVTDYERKSGAVKPIPKKKA
jgi:hypothetical protein